jgi:hypothetical protein
MAKLIRGKIAFLQQENPHFKIAKKKLYLCLLSIHPSILAEKQPIF